MILPSKPFRISDNIYIYNIYIYIYGGCIRALSVDGEDWARMTEKQSVWKKEWSTIVIKHLKYRESTTLSGNRDRLQFRTFFSLDYVCNICSRFILFKDVRVQDNKQPQSNCWHILTQQSTGNLCQIYDKIWEFASGLRSHIKANCINVNANVNFFLVISYASDLPRVKLDRGVTSELTGILWGIKEMVFFCSGSH